MSTLSKFRLPYRDDSLFGILFLVALIIPLAFDVYNFESFEIIKFGLLMVFLGFAGLIFFNRYAGERSSLFNLRTSRFFYLSLFFFCTWAFLATIFATDTNYSFFGFYPRITNGFLFYFVWAGLFFLLSLLNKEKLWFLIKVLFFCSGLVGLWALLESLSIGYYSGVSSEFFVRSAPSFLGNPNFSSMFMAVFAPLGLYFLYTTGSLWKRIYFGLSLFIQVSSIIILASRGAIVALFVGLFVSLALTVIARKAGLLKFTLACLLAIAIAFTMAQAFLNFVRPGTVQATISLSESNVQERLGVWSLTLSAIKSKPVIGWGLGNFELVFEKNRGLSNVKTGFFDDPHNLFLYLAVTGGVPFLFLFLFLILFPVAAELKKIIRNQSEQALESVALIGAIAAWMSAAFFTPVAVPCYVILIFLTSGLMVDIRVLNFPKYNFAVSTGKILSVVIILYAICFISAEHLFFAGIKSYNNGDFKTAHLLTQTAVYLNPINNLYFEYLAGSAIRASNSVSEINKDIEKFSKFHSQRSYTYIQIANLNYLRFFKTHDLAYKAVIYSNMNRAIGIDPLSSNNYFLFSQYQFIFGDFSEAIASVNKGLELQPKNFEAKMFLAKIYQYLGNREMFIKILQTANPDADNVVNLANLLKMSKTAADIRALPLNIKFSVGQLD